MVATSGGLTLHMKGDTQNGFRLKDWQVYPLRNLLVGPPGEIHIEPKVMQVLESLASNPGQVVERDKLLNDLWGGRAFSDEPLTRCIAALRHALGDSPTNPQYIQTIPKSGYRLVCPVESLTHTAEDANGDVGELSDTYEGELITRRRRIALPAFLGLILIAVLYVAYRIALIDPTESPQLTVEGRTQSEPPIHSIAVLPFVNMSSDPEQEYFSDGISEELLNVLSRIPGLRVVARTSSFQFKGENRDVIDIGQRLNVAHVLEGSVRKVGLHIRISAQLVDARSGFQLWSETYDREFENIFAVQDEISAAVFMALKEHLGVQIEAAPRVIATANTEAHDAYLRGRYLVVQRELAVEGAVEGAVREFEKAIALDPNYALAHAELAIATLLLSRNAGLTFTEVIARAIPYAERAMALDPTLAEAHAATGLLSSRQWKTEEALTHFRQAIRLNPNYSIVYTWMGGLLSAHLGRYKEGFAMKERALRLDPLSKPAVANYIRALIERSLLAEADRELEKIASVYPYLYVSMRGIRMSFGGNWANELLADLDTLRINPKSLTLRNHALAPQFAVIGLENEAIAISEELPHYVLLLLGRTGNAVTSAEARLAEDPMSPGAGRDLGRALASAGEYGRARPILEEMWQRNGRRVGYRSLIQIHEAAALIAIRRDAGMEAEAGEVLAAIRDNVRRYREAGYTGGWRFLSVDYNEGLAAYLAGEREKGLALIAKGAENGRFILPNEAYLQVLYDDPGFAPIRAAQEARQVRERDKVLAVICTDNPYAAVWQPAQETCEQLVAASEN